MAGVLRHRKLSTKPEATDPTKILASDWGSSNTNYATAPSHVLAGGSHGALLWYDTSAIDNANWLPGVASGSVLVSGGVNQPASWSASPTLTSLTLGVPLSPANGGTGFASYAVGDLIYASGSATLAKLADVAVGSVMASGGVGIAPSWSATPSLTSLTLSTPLAAPSGGTGFGSFAVGDILYASATNALSKLADVAVGSVMVSGGVNTAPAWSATPTLTSVGFSGGAVFNGATTNVVEQRNSTSAQALRVYNTFTSATSYERFAIDWSNVANRTILSVEKGSAGGTQRSLGLMADALYFYVNAGVSVIQPWQMNTSGHLLATTDATYDIGASNATRPNNLYVASRVTCDNVLASTAIALTNVGGSGFKTSNGGFMIFQSDGVLKFSDNANTSFGRLQLGGTTSSFPAIKRSAATIQIRLADDSAYALIEASQVKTNNGTFLSSGTALTNGAGVATGTLTNAPAAGNPTKWIPIDDNGTTRYIPTW